MNDLRLQLRVESVSSFLNDLRGEYNDDLYHRWGGIWYLASCYNRLYDSDLTSSIFCFDDDVACLASFDVLVFIFPVVLL